MLGLNWREELGMKLERAKSVSIVLPLLLLQKKNDVLNSPQVELLVVP